MSRARISLGLCIKIKKYPDIDELLDFYIPQLRQTVDSKTKPSLSISQKLKNSLRLRLRRGKEKEGGLESCFESTIPSFDSVVSGSVPEFTND